jgi:hypothetical protein
MTAAFLRRAGQAIGGAVALGILVLTVRSALVELSTEPPPFHAGRAVLATLGLAGAYLGTVGVWRSLLRDLGVRVRFVDALQLWSFSNLGRYLPGKIWQVVGVVVVARDIGISGGVAAAAAFVCLAFQIGTGALLGLVLLPDRIADGGSAVGGAVGWIVVLLGAGLLLPVVRPGIVSGVLRRLPRSLGCADVPPLSRGAVLRLIVAFTGVWIAHGAMFQLFASAFGPTPPGAYPLYAGAYALAYVVGLVAVFAPGGIGVREGMIGVLLGAGAPAAIPVHLLAVAARVWAIAAEVLVLALALAVRRRDPDARARP